MFLRLFPALLIAGSLASAQEEELTPYSVSEIGEFLNVFKQTYKAKRTPEDDAVAVIDDLTKAYLYLGSKGDKATKEEIKAQADIVKMISKGLRARNRDLVTVHCVMFLGDVRAEAANKDLMKWLEKVLDEKGPHPQHVEKGYLALAWIGSKDKRARDLALKYAQGKHQDMGVASWAMRACYEWRALDPKTRKEFFNKILGYLGGLHSSMTGGEAKNRATYEQRYNAVKDYGLTALGELAGTGKKFADPPAAREFWNDNKKKKWEPYVGPKFRKKATKKAAAPEEESKGTEGG